MTKATTLKSPLKYPGGKTYLAPKIVGLMAPHKRYVETHFGGGAVLFGKDPEGVSEYVNDIDFYLTNFWNVLRHGDMFLRFMLGANATPLCQHVFHEAKTVREHGAVDAALDFFIRNRQSRQGLGKDFATPTSRIRRGMNENVSAWLSAVDGLPEVHARLRRVEIRNQDACDLIKELDSPATLFYCDPPYLHETRVTKDQYRHEMTGKDHCRLLHCLSKIKGKFLLSGYPSHTYLQFANKYRWHLREYDIDNKASGAKTKRIMTECVWANYEI